MATSSSTQARIEKVLVEAASLLVERARTQIEREIAAASDSSPDESHDAELQRLRVLEDELAAIREQFARTTVAAAIGPQLSRYYDVPGQEDS
jgi:hypothetical protein